MPGEDGLRFDDSRNRFEGFPAQLRTNFGEGLPLAYRFSI